MDRLVGLERMQSLRLHKLLPRSRHHGHSAIWTPYRENGDRVGVWILSRPAGGTYCWTVIMGSDECAVGLQVSRILNGKKFRTRREAVQAVGGVLARLDVV